MLLYDVISSQENVRSVQVRWKIELSFTQVELFYKDSGSLRKKKHKMFTRTCDCSLNKIMTLFLKILCLKKLF